MTSDCCDDSALVQDIDPQLLSALTEQIKEAKSASYAMSILSESQKNYALGLIERELRESVSTIIDANKKDLESPDNANLPSAMKDRLMLNPERIMAIANSVRKITAMKDPVGNILDGWQHPNGMRITKVRVLQ